MTQLDQFVEDAIRTESRIDSVNVNIELLLNTLHTLIDAGNILDQIKKNVFYDKPYDVFKLKLLISTLKDSVDSLDRIDLDNSIDDKTKLDINPRIFHSIAGIATESTELLEALDVSGANMDNINIAEEFGDIDWYKAIGVDELDIGWNTILDAVIAKLKARYPQKFTSENAINRDLDKEREVLEQMDVK